jgi:hypothetical protein
LLRTKPLREAGDAQTIRRTQPWQRLAPQPT